MFNGKTHYKWAIFNSYVKLPEGKQNFPHYEKRLRGKNPISMMVFVRPSRYLARAQKRRFPKARAKGGCLSSDLPAPCDECTYMDDRQRDRDLEI